MIEATLFMHSHTQMQALGGEVLGHSFLIDGVSKRLIKAEGYEYEQCIYMWVRSGKTDELSRQCGYKQLAYKHTLIQSAATPPNKLCACSFSLPLPKRTGDYKLGLHIIQCALFKIPDTQVLVSIAITIRAPVTVTLGRKETPCQHGGPCKIVTLRASDVI